MIRSAIIRLSIIWNNQQPLNWLLFFLLYDLEFLLFFMLSNEFVRRMCLSSGHISHVFQRPILLFFFVLYYRKYYLIKSALHITRISNFLCQDTQQIRFVISKYSKLDDDLYFKNIRTSSKRKIILTKKSKIFFGFYFRLLDFLDFVCGVVTDDDD